MTLASNLKNIKDIPYAVAGISEKMNMIEALLSGEASLNKWWVAKQVFHQTRLFKSVLACDVKHQLQYHFKSTDSTLSAKADAVSALVGNYEKFVDVNSLVKEVFVDSYPAIVEQINQNKIEHEEFQKRILNMPSNSSIDGVATVMLQVQEDMKKI